MERMNSETPSSLLLNGDLTQLVIGAFYDTYNDLGSGFPEFVTRRALAIVIREAGLSVFEEVELPVWFHGQKLAGFRADLLVADKLIVEVKTSLSMEAFHQAQVLHYLKATNHEVGLLVNFGREPQFKRVVYSEARKRRHFDPPTAAALQPQAADESGGTPAP